MSYQTVMQQARDGFKRAVASAEQPSVEDFDSIVQYVNNNPDWVNDVTECGNANTLAYLYANAIVQKRDTSKLPEIDPSSFLKVAQIASCIKQTNLKKLSKVIS